jgi:hypothetical protein
MTEIQELLMNDDCWLPGKSRHVSQICKKSIISTSDGDSEKLRNGHDRHIGEDMNGWTCQVGDWVEYKLEKPEKIKEIRLVFDSELSRFMPNMVSVYPIDPIVFKTPEQMVKGFRLEAQTADGGWKTLIIEGDNYQRLVRIPVDETVQSIKLTITATHGRKKVDVFSFDFK